MHPDGKCHLFLLLQVPTPIRIGTARRRSQQDGLDLEKYITMLPVPSAPQAWMQMCGDIEKHGAAAFDAWMHADPCDLPDIQGSPGKELPQTGCWPAPLSTGCPLPRWCLILPEVSGIAEGMYHMTHHVRHMRAGAHCQLGRRAWAHRFQQPLMAAYAASLFHYIVAGRTAAGRQLGAPAPQLSRFDLFHGHVFVAAANHTTNSSSKEHQQHVDTTQAGQPQQSQHTHIKQRGVSVPYIAAQHTRASKQQQLPEVGILVSLTSIAPGLLCIVRKAVASTCINRVM